MPLRITTHGYATSWLKPLIDCQPTKRCLQDTFEYSSNVSGSFEQIVGACTPPLYP